MVSGRKILFAGKSFRKFSQAQRADIIVRDGKWKINEHNFFCCYGNNNFILIETVAASQVAKLFYLFPFLVFACCLPNIL